MADSKLTDVLGVGIVKAKLLESHGINSVIDLMNCSVDKLCQVPGIKEISANILKANAGQLLEDNKLSTEQSSKDKIKDSKKKKKNSKGKQKKKKSKDKKKKS